MPQLLELVFVSLISTIVLSFFYLFGRYVYTYTGRLKFHVKWLRVSGISSDICLGVNVVVYLTSSVLCVNYMYSFFRVYVHMGVPVQLHRVWCMALHG